jgi:hypothetical protein
VDITMVIAVPAMLVIFGQLLMHVGSPRKGSWPRVIGAMMTGLGVLSVFALGALLLSI